MSHTSNNKVLPAPKPDHNTPNTTKIDLNMTNNALCKDSPRNTHMDDDYEYVPPSQHDTSINNHHLGDQMSSASMIQLHASIDTST